MKHKQSKSKIKITRPMLLSCLLILNLIAVVLLFSINLRIASAPNDVLRDRILTKTGSVASVTAIPRPSAAHQPEVANNRVPFIANDKFHEIYSKYNGQLPAMERDARVVDTSCGQWPDYFDFFSLPKSHRSRFFEDKIIYDTFFKESTTPFSFPRNERDSSRTLFYSSAVHQQSPQYGTYVELGAFDGREESNTVFFDKCLRWDGLLIEAQSQSYQKVVENRPNAVKLSFSPTCIEDKSEAEGAQTASFYNYPLSNNGMKDLALSYKGKDTVQVPCGPFTPVLKDIFGPNQTISFLSLDVEGAESLVLDTIDLSVVHIDVVMIEIQNSYCPNPTNCPQVHRIRKRMAEANYSLFGELVEASDVYAKLGTEPWRRGMALKGEMVRQQWIAKRKILREEKKAMMQ
ncbi:hypothetical protein HJC23_009092 [Cyclotella cryptica]|uniref:Methyltransferase FkbM domain-containing protein n=1 Tax=Cyclotella cryptica TaxID=29204 RepID=A0ABD3QYQ2_9STRA|eukprot:CCRYP_000716-RA/>CCRYP_000716-RA protein AED:0.02 eAED:0.02 QI:360/1/1/1/0/0/2/706/403